MVRMIVKRPDFFSRARVLVIGFGLAVNGGCARHGSGTAFSAEGTQSNGQQQAVPGIQQDWKTVIAPIADLTLALPKELSEGATISEPGNNGDVTWTNYSYDWKTQGDKRDLRLDVYVLVSITNWDKDFPPELGGGSPEDIIQRRYAGTEPHKKRGEIEELALLELDGVKGVFFRAPQGQDKNRIQLYWSTYRYYKKKAQHVAITINGPRTDLDKLMKIVQSAKLATG